jgi:hypothetical protein
MLKEAALASVLAYVAIVLTAMQLGIATDTLGHSSTFQSASYIYTVFSLAVPLVLLSSLILGILVLIASNWSATKSYERKRFGEMGVEPFWRKR